MPLHPTLPERKPRKQARGQEEGAGVQLSEEQVDGFACKHAQGGCEPARACGASASARMQARSICMSCCSRADRQVHVCTRLHACTHARTHARTYASPPLRAPAPPMPRRPVPRPARTRQQHRHPMVTRPICSGRSSPTRRCSSCWLTRNASRMPSQGIQGSRWAGWVGSCQAHPAQAGCC